MLITTVFSDAELLIEAVEIGVDGYIIKPINITKLLDSLYDATKNLLLKKELRQQSENFHIMMDGILQNISLQEVDEYYPEIAKELQRLLEIEP